MQMRKKSNHLKRDEPILCPKKCKTVLVVGQKLMDQNKNEKDAWLQMETYQIEGIT